MVSIKYRAAVRERKAHKVTKINNIVEAEEWDNSANQFSAIAVDVGRAPVI